MYKIDSMHDGAMEAFFHALNQGKVERWMAAFAWWFYRQYIGNAPEYWAAMAGKITAELPAADRVSILEQLSKAEDAIVAAATDWPERPANIDRYVSSWDPQLPAPDIAVLRADAVRRIDREAETYRLRFITDGSGQVMAYQQKLAEAKAKMANGSIANAAIPHIVAEAAVDGVTLTEKAEQIVATFEAWQTISAGIEAKRMAAKKAVAAAETSEAVASAAAVVWEGLGE
ncbi:hypothetical protein OE766_03580 [Pararhizobium sp. YC-54]|uniref:hypothetical protein n=1 Tax=Pararhizobium sp. YC-54 TaxID=2986920 RepID=UPI0021F78320|nr:hypothetical protein [Pararhizobium sp. YC-54]MCV9997318.1 hypothetical protein [Pararhizobium sp. YC-54]